jgi:hypothetical protein
MEFMSAHPGELKLRRFRAGELQGIEAREAEGHFGSCGHCRARLKVLEQEQEQFERDISFDRFAAGVQRAVKDTEARRLRWRMPAIGMAAAVLVAIAVAPIIKAVSPQQGVRTKGGANVMLRIGGTASGRQRVVSAQTPELLAPGERVRIGYQAGAHRYLVAISIDERGTVTELYAEQGSSLQIGPGDETLYLPESLEFTGTGLERVVVILGDQPLPISRVKAAAEAAFDAVRGDLRQLRTLDVPGEQFHRLLIKP